MAEVILKNITKHYNGTEVVSNISLEIADREFFVLVGPSGCGKSTTLRMVAGLEEITSGEIWIGGHKVNDISAKDRDIAMVFQNYSLYPHMTVYENMAFGLKLRGYSKREIKTRVQETAEILNMGHLLERKPKELSGGQRQRVAVGRAIVRKPKVFLFDEPLSNLDAKLRVQMRMELSKLHDRLQTTILYVTHDQVEAMTMGDKICVMKEGVIQQVAPPLQLYNQPANRFVAGFVGSPPMNFMNVTIVEKNEAAKSGLWLKELGVNHSSSNFELKVKKEIEPALKPYLNKTVTLGIRPEDIYDRLFYAGEIHEGSWVKATVEVVEPMGPEKYLYLNTGKNNLIARVEPQNSAKPQQDIDIVVNMNKIRIFDKESQKAIL